MKSLLHPIELVNEYLRVDVGTWEGIVRSFIARIFLGVEDRYA